MAQTVDSRGPTGRRGCLYARTKPEPQSLTPKDRFSNDSRSGVVHAPPMQAQTGTLPDSCLECLDLVPPMQTASGIVTDQF